jgi:hypothetical protein
MTVLDLRFQRAHLPDEGASVGRFDMRRSAEYARVEWRGVTPWEVEII